MSFRLSNPYQGAGVRTIVFFAAVHLLMVTTDALRGNLNALNAFAIVRLDAIAPAIGRGALSFVLSYAFVLAVFLAMLWSRRRTSEVSGR